MNIFKKILSIFRKDKSEKKEDESWCNAPDRAMAYEGTSSEKWAVANKKRAEKSARFICGYT
jgi:hypothetical protein